MLLSGNQILQKKFKKLKLIESQYFFQLSLLTPKANSKLSFQKNLNRCPIMAWMSRNSKEMGTTLLLIT